MPVGAPGTTESVGTTAFEAADSWPPPAALTAWTVNVYDVPGVRPVIFFEVGSGEPVTVVGVSDDEADVRRHLVGGGRAAAAARRGPAHVRAGVAGGRLDAG